MGKAQNALACFFPNTHWMCLSRFMIIGQPMSYGQFPAKPCPLQGFFLLITGIFLTNHVHLYLNICISVPQGCIANLVLIQSKSTLLFFTLYKLATNPFYHGSPIWSLRLFYGAHWGRLIAIRDEPNEGGVIHKFQELDRLMTGGSAVCVQGDEQRGKNAALRGTGADGPGVQDMFPYLHMLAPVRQRVCVPPAGEVRHV